MAAAAITHVLVTTVVVVITANHWWLDAIIGSALLVLAAIVLPAPASIRPDHDECAAVRATARTTRREPVS